jgi:hypothetical protein
MYDMTAISTTARRVLDILPADGSTLSGGKIKDRLRINTTEFTDAKSELKEAGLVILGRGRGGSLARVEGVEVPEAPQKKTKEESLEIAREEKAAISKVQRELNAMKETAVAAGRKHFPDADDYKPGLSEDRWYCEIWRNKTANIYFLTEEDLLYAAS